MILMMTVLIVLIQCACRFNGCLAQSQITDWVTCRSLSLLRVANTENQQKIKVIK